MSILVMPFDFCGHSVRVFEFEGATWFVAKGVAEVLGYVNPQKAIRDHCKSARPVGGLNRSPLISGLDPQTKIIPESDVYRLIMRSRLPSAEKFEEWVVADLLPTVRRTGRYDVGDVDKLMQTTQQLLGHTQKLEKKIEEDRPKVEGFDRIAGAEGTLSLTESSKLVKITRKELIKLLDGLGWIYRGGRGVKKAWFASHKGIDRGWVSYTGEPYQVESGHDLIDRRVRLTPKGLAKVSEILSGLDR